MRINFNDIVPTAPPGTSNNQAASTAFVQNALGGVGSAAVGILNALQNPVTGASIKGDGVTNDAANINTLLNSIGSSGLGVYFPGNHTYECGNTTILDPGGIYVIGGPGAVLRRSSDPTLGYGSSPAGYTSAFVAMGSYSRWNGFTFSNTAVYATSTTSITTPLALDASGHPTSPFTMQTQTGLALGTGNFTGVRVWSASTPGCGFEGTFTGYNSGTGVLTFGAGSVLFNLGTSGTKTDWNITLTGVYAAPFVMHALTDCICSDFRVIGNWYTGPLIDGWSSGGTLQAVNCSLVRGYCESVQNRGISIYGNHFQTEIDSCWIVGNSITDYGINCNPANQTPNVNALNGLKITDCKVSLSNFQGITIGDQAFYCNISGCVVEQVQATSGVGFLDSAANGGVPSYNEWNGNIANACPIGHYFVGSLYPSLIGYKGIACGIGLQLASSGANTTQFVKGSGITIQGSTNIGVNIQANTSRCDLDVQVENSTNAGVQIDSTATNNTIQGRSYNNGTNLVDPGAPGNGSDTARLRQT